MLWDNEVNWNHCSSESYIQNWLKGGSIGTMATASDRRKTVGAIVHTKKWHLRSFAECERRYGARKKTKLVRGVVIEALSNYFGQRESGSSQLTTNLAGWSQAQEAKHSVCIRLRDTRFHREHRRCSCRPRSHICDRRCRARCLSSSSGIVALKCPCQTS